MMVVTRHHPYLYEPSESSSLYVYTLEYLFEGGSACTSIAFIYMVRFCELIGLILQGMNVRSYLIEPAE